MAFRIPQLQEIPSFYHNYIMQVKDSDLMGLLQLQKDEVINLYQNLNKEDWGFAYAEGKWSLAVLLRHMIDSEQVFLYRALCFSRNDVTSLPGFDENLWAESTLHHPSLLNPDVLLNQYQLQRDLSISFFKNLDEKNLFQMGEANGKPMNANSIGFIICGHEAHHLNMIKERYLKARI